MVSACSIAVLYILVLLKPGEYSTEVFSFHFADAVLIILALWFFFLTIFLSLDKQERKMDANWRR